MTLRYDFNGDDFEYDADWEDIKEELIDMLTDGLRDKEGSLFSYDGAYQMAVYIIRDLDFADAFFEAFEEEIKEAFEDKAYESYKEACEEEREKEDWYGTKANILGGLR